jgi:hypothetical protein
MENQFDKEVFQSMVPLFPAALSVSQQQKPQFGARPRLTSDVLYPFHSLPQGYELYLESPDGRQGLTIQPADYSGSLIVTEYPWGLIHTPHYQIRSTEVTPSRELRAYPLYSEERTESDAHRLGLALKTFRRTNRPGFLPQHLRDSLYHLPKYRFVDLPAPQSGGVVRIQRQIGQIDLVHFPQGAHPKTGLLGSQPRTAYTLTGSGEVLGADPSHSSVLAFQALWEEIRPQWEQALKTLAAQPSRPVGNKALSPDLKLTPQLLKLLDIVAEGRPRQFSQAVEVSRTPDRLIFRINWDLGRRLSNTSTHSEIIVSADTGTLRQGRQGAGNQWKTLSSKDVAMILETAFSNYLK